MPNTRKSAPVIGQSVKYIQNDRVNEVYVPKVLSGFAFDCTAYVASREPVPFFANAFAVQHRLFPLLAVVKSYPVPVTRFPELSVGFARSSLYHSISAGSLYVQALFTTTCPTAHVCADARKTHTNTSNAPKSRMRHTRRAFIHTGEHVGFVYLSLMQDNI